MSRQIIRIMLSCGQIEEGVLENWSERDETDNSLWAVISIKDNPTKKLRINKKYIAAHQIEELSEITKKPLQVEHVGPIRENVSSVNSKFNTTPILRAKRIAEQKLADDLLKKRQLSQEYVENVYSSPASCLRKFNV